MRLQSHFRRNFLKLHGHQKVIETVSKELEEMLHGATFPGQKAYTMLGIAKASIEQYEGELPADFEKLTELKGVGPKCANLALGVAHKQAAISVDVHVHRVTNRWGFIQTALPEQTMLELEKKVAKQKWIDINRLLMPFGKHICTQITSLFNLPRTGILQTGWSY